LVPEYAFELDLRKGNGCVAGHECTLECDAGFGNEEMNAGGLDAETDTITRSQLRALRLDQLEISVARGEISGRSGGFDRADFEVKRRSLVTHQQMLWAHAGNHSPARLNVSRQRQGTASVENNGIAAFRNAAGQEIH